MKIAVLGNCQGDSLAVCLRAMNPSLVVDYAFITDLKSGARDRAALFQENDLIFAQPSIAAEFSDIPPEKLHLFPAIAFPAFHPDMIYVRGKRKDGGMEAVHSPMVIYHSAIALFCYLHNTSIDDTVGWFNRFVFNRFGYLDRWEESRNDLLAEGMAAGMPLGELFGKWSRAGNFMYTMNHPRLPVMQDLARKLLERAGVPVINHNVVDYLVDPLRKVSIWPVYPLIAEGLGLVGDFNFKPPDEHNPMTLREFVQCSFEIYDLYERETLEPIGFSIEEHQIKALAPVGVSADAPRNPYSNARPVQFWKNSVAGVRAEELDPVVDPKFSIGRTDKIATAGSCFAQHVARTLARSGFNYFVPETAPEGMGEAEAKVFNYGTYSARYGNIYTVRQLVQLIQRAMGTFTPVDEVWSRKDGKLVDPFRPQIQPEGFESVEALKASREIHFEAIRTMLREMDVFVFTLGLTEGWRSRYDGAVFPLAPGVAGGVTDFEIYEFHNFTVEETCADLDRAFDLIRSINPDCRIILTVSPVPLIATYESRHALVATTYSKSVLRAAAEYARRAYDFVEYFPSYEIITGSYNKGAYYQEDQREVTEAGVSHVMGVLMKHYTASESDAAAEREVPVAAEVQPKKKSLFDVVCDEEAILNF